jgi:hypothetical protein
MFEGSTTEEAMVRGRSYELAAALIVAMIAGCPAPRGGLGER